MPLPPFSACVWLNAAAAAGRGTSRPLVAAFAKATLAGGGVPALARYPANRRYLEGTSGVAGGWSWRVKLIDIGWGEMGAERR